MLREGAARNDVGKGTKARVRVMVGKLQRFGIIRFADLTVENITRAHNELIRTEKASTTAFIPSTIAGVSITTVSSQIRGATPQNGIFGFDAVAVCCQGALPR
jgi:phage-related tail protein